MAQDPRDSETRKLIVFRDVVEEFVVHSADCSHRHRAWETANNCFSMYAYAGSIELVMEQVLEEINEDYEEEDMFCEDHVELHHCCTKSRRWNE